MYRLAVLVGVLVLLAPLSSKPAKAIPYEEARHLLARTGFGQPTPSEIAALVPYDYGQAVDRLLLEAGTVAILPPPPWANDSLPGADVRGPRDEAAKRALQQKVREHAIDLKAWWLQEMIATPSPLTERMVLFWHSHFTSALSKVKWPGFMYRQNALLRRHALGNFGSLFSEIARDPAMLIYLDGRANHVGQPNENFARELFELFAFGEGKGYTERDVREAARALTGWTVDPRTGNAQFMPRRHDAGIKTVLGQSGKLGPDDVINIMLHHPRLAEHIAEKMWREFISAMPDPADTRRLAAVFRASNYEIKPLLRAVLTRAQFRDPANRGTLIKSPVDLTIGTLRLFAAARAQRTPAKPMMAPLAGPELVRALRALGQDVFEPPNVKGWPGGEAWITTASLPLREAFLRRIARGLDDAFPGGNPPKEAKASDIAAPSRSDMPANTSIGVGVSAGSGSVGIGTGVGIGADLNRGTSNPSAPPASTPPGPDRGFEPDQLEKLLLPTPPADSLSGNGTVAARVARLLLDPAYQLK